MDFLLVPSHCTLWLQILHAYSLVMLERHSIGHSALARLLVTALDWTTTEEALTIPLPEPIPVCPTMPSHLSLSIIPEVSRERVGHDRFQRISFSWTPERRRPKLSMTIG
jgi:hypothetical protein